MMGWIALFVAGVAVLVLLASAPRHVTVQPWETVLIYAKGRFVRAVGPGQHWCWSLVRPTIVRVITAEQATAAGPLDVFAQEGFAFRVTLGLVYRVVDPRAWHEATAAQPGFVGMRLPGFDDTVAAAALAAAGARPLAQTLADPQPIAAAVTAAVGPRFPALAIVGVTVARVTLPPEVRRLLTEVETARLQGLAALERARGEQAALRSLANAARLVRDNPELAQLRLLQAIEGAKRPPTIVLGQPGLGATPPGPASPAD